jgi:hypothetical protein
LILPPLSNRVSLLLHAHKRILIAVLRQERKESIVEVDAAFPASTRDVTCCALNESRPRTTSADQSTTTAADSMMNVSPMGQRGKCAEESRGVVARMSHRVVYSDPIGAIAPAIRSM